MRLVHSTKVRIPTMTVSFLASVHYNSTTPHMILVMVIITVITVTLININIVIDVAAFVRLLTIRLGTITLL